MTNLHTRAADMLERLHELSRIWTSAETDKECRSLIAELRAAAALDELVRENERLGLYDDQKPCWCHQCNPTTGLDRRMILCPTCGNKRCPKANDHRNACSGSNEPGQEGSAYAAPAPAQPRQPLSADDIADALIGTREELAAEVRLLRKVRQPLSDAEVRSQFESWLIDHFGASQLKQRPNGDYESVKAHFAWLGYQGACRNFEQRERAITGDKP